MACRPLVCNYYSTMPSTTFREPKFSHAMAAPILPLATCQIICLAFQITCILKPPPNTTFLEWPYLNKSSLMCEWWRVPPVEKGKNSPFPPLALFFLLNNQVDMRKIDKRKSHWILCIQEPCRRESETLNTWEVQRLKEDEEYMTFWAKEEVRHLGTLENHCRAIRREDV